MLYLDPSAIVKLVAREPETPDLVEVLRDDPEVISSALAWTEVKRAVRRVRGRIARAAEVLDGIAFVPIDGGILRAAADLEPAGLRTLDAIHVATVLSLGDDISGLVAYDRHLADAVAAAGIPVAAPGAD
ncbi:MAG TPA: type II toxin-antitoxin system VapC family toxin [Actinomycetota bacterium]|nr:type II toxin-antitoxin system VapC family toxin [Actinomycetota bacterium]